MFEICKRFFFCIFLQEIKTNVLDKYGVRCDPKLGFLLLPVVVNGQVVSVKKLTCHSQSADTVGSVRETFTPR